MMEQHTRIYLRIVLHHIAEVYGHILDFLQSRFPVHLLLLYCSPILFCASMWRFYSDKAGLRQLVTKTVAIIVPLFVPLPPLHPQRAFAMIQPPSSDACPSQHFARI